MFHAMRLCIVGVLAGLASGASLGIEAWDDRTEVVPAARAAEAAPARLERVGPLGATAVDAKVLARRRGGTDVMNEMQLKGVVADNRAVNVATGNNFITEGAFAGTSGLPIVVQNSGNNVLIQNATIINVQVK